MGLLENLVQGLSNAAGSSTGQRIEQSKADRRATQQEELHANTGLILDEVNRLHGERDKLHPGVDDQAIRAIDTRLGELQKNFTDLYHPEKNPGALQHLGGILKSHLGGKKQPPKTPAEAKERFSFASGAPVGEPDAVAQFKRTYKEATGKDAMPEVMEEFARKQGGIPEPLARPDWKPFKVGDQIRYFDVSKPDTIPPDATAVVAGGEPKPQKPIRAWKKVGGKTVSVLLDPATNKEIPNSENSEIQPPSTMTGRITTGYYHFVDSDGNVHQVEETHTSSPAGSGAPSIPKTPGEAKQRVLGHKGTPTENKAKADVVEATKLSSIADQVAQHPDDAINQKRLAVALERASAGRFTTQALDYIIKAGWGNTIEQWANSSTTGALPADVMRQLVDGAHENLKAAQDALKTAQAGSSSSPSSGELTYNPKTGKLE